MPLSKRLGGARQQWQWPLAARRVGRPNLSGGGVCCRGEWDVGPATQLGYGFAGIAYFLNDIDVDEPRLLGLALFAALPANGPVDECRVLFMPDLFALNSEYH